MHIRRLLILVVFALAAASCGAAPSTESVPTPRALAYSLTGERELVYDQTIDMDASVAFGGTFSALDPSAPDQMDMSMAMGLRTVYGIDEGDEAGTFRVAMAVEDLRMHSGSVTVAGEVVDMSQPGFEDAIGADFMPEMEFLITERGEVLTATVDGETVDVAAMLGGDPFGGFAGPTQLFGPELPAGDVAVGDSWTSSYSRPFVPGREVAVASTHRIVGEDTVDGHRTLVIETISTMDAVEITSADLLRAMETYGERVPAEELDALAGMNMVWRMPPSSPTATAWFDPVAGVVRRQITNVDTTMTIEMSGIPGTPGPVTMETAMSMRQTMQLVG